MARPRPSRTARAAAAAAVLVGVLVLVVGWGMDVEAMRSVVPGTVGMKPSTAAMFVLSGIALWLLAGGSTRRRHYVAAGCAAACILLSFAFLAEYVFHVSLGIDEFPFRDEAGRAKQLVYPGRIAPMTAISFILLSSALLTIDLRRRLSEPLVAPVVGIGATCLIGYLYAIPVFYGPGSVGKMALSTAVLFLILSTGVLMARPRGRLHSLLTTESPGGSMARRLLPVAVLVPLLLGWLSQVGESWGVFSDRAGEWWLTGATIAVLCLVVAQAAQGLDRGVRQAQRRFETAFQDAPIGIALVDLEGRVLKANQALYDITGYDGDQLVAKRFADLVHPGDRETEERNARELLASDCRAFTVENRFVRRDGSALWALHSASLVRDDDDQPLNFIAHVQDITRQREDAEALAAAKHELEGQVDQMQELDRLKEEFVAIVTHELRTPITSVAGYLDLLLEVEEDDPAPLEPHRRHYAEVARRNAQRLIDLVSDLLLVRRLESGHEELARVKLDLSALTYDRLESMSPAAGAKHVGITVDVAAGIVVDADPRRLAQVIDNLLSNAVKYTPEGGNVWVSLANGGPTVRLAVRDNGIGVPANEQEQLFDPFFRASNVTRGAVSGTGLGLVVTRQLVEAHGGTIAVDSVAGTGSTFRVTLPCGRAVTAPAPDASAAAG